jgi:hypothetical protein
MSANGRLTTAELSPIGDGYYLARQAASAFNAMSAESRRRWGRSITVVSAYRTYDKQVQLWNLYRSGRGNLAAYPGSSNHGWGLAIDLSSQWCRWAVDQIGRTYGFSKACSDAQSEWWHIKYNPSCTGASFHPGSAPAGPRVLRQGMKGKDVEEVQIYLLRGGYLRKGDPAHKIPPAIDGTFGPATKIGVQNFQRKVGLKADGVVGPATISALRNRYR